MLKNLFTLIIGLLGAAVLSYGAWSIYQPAGYVTGGVLLMFWSYVQARANAALEYSQRKKPTKPEDS